MVNSKDKESIAFMNQKRSISWIDGAKILAIIMVVSSHFYMSMSRTGWVDKDAVYYYLPIRLALCIPVQIFFVCSGFLYQLFKKETNFTSHLLNIKNKAIALGIPYFVFSIISLLLKNVFSGSVNSKPTPILKTLFVHPMPPYWYLYILFILFILIPRVTKKRNLYIILAVSIVAKVFVLLPHIALPFFVSRCCNNAIWFAIGMLLTTINFKYNILERIIFIMLAVAGVLVTLRFFVHNQNNTSIDFLVSILFVFPILYLFIYFMRNGRGSSLSRFRKYILPIFLMHTIFASMIRIALLKIGVANVAIHIMAGLTASFALPALVYFIAEKKWFLLMFIEPFKAMKMRKKESRIKNSY